MESASPMCGRRHSALIAAAVLGVGVFALPANAAFITFDPDGAEPANAPQTVAGLDWAVGNSLAQNFAEPVAGSNFQHMYQATLAGVINTSGLTVAPTGNNIDFELTAVMSATEVITTTTVAGATSSVSSKLAPVQSPSSFFEIWFDTTPDADNLAGTGFNDGVRIYFGSPDTTKPSLSNIAFDTSGTFLYDLFGADNYAGKQTYLASGSFLDQNTVTAQDASFFITQIASMTFNTTKVDPFTQVNPSQVFAGLANGIAPAVAPNLATINGDGTGFGTNGVQFQADANSSFTAVPEPGAATVMMGVALSLAARRRRR
jgi:hypothetical protein